LNAPLFHKRYNYDILKRFNFARSLEDPVSRFLSLYAMLSSVANDNQQQIDELIRTEEPTVACSPSPRHSRPETIFTRLRNELAHHREGVSVFATHDEIRLHVGRFEGLVRRILEARIEGA
jgi:response regulator of citrate/malate metabolism